MIFVDNDCLLQVCAQYVLLRQMYKKFAVFSRGHLLFSYWQSLAICLQYTDAVGWAAGRARSL